MFVSSGDLTIILPLASIANQLLPCWWVFLSRNWDGTSETPVVECVEVWKGVEAGQGSIAYAFTNL